MEEMELEQTRMDPRDILADFDLPESLNEKLEELLKLDREESRFDQNKYDQELKDLKEIRKQFREQYKKLQGYFPSKLRNLKKDALGSEDKRSEGSDSDLDFPDASDIGKVIGKLADGYTKGEQRKKSKEEYRALLERSRRAFAELMDEPSEGSIKEEYKKKVTGADSESDNEEIDRIIAEIRGSRRSSFSPSGGAGQAKNGEIQG